VLAPRGPERDVTPRRFAVSVAFWTTAVAVFLGAQLRAWPPHENEAVALFIGRKSLGGALNTVLEQRGGAPLHFLVAWLVAHTGGGLTELRIVSAVLAAASVPVLALLAARLAGRAVALTATILVSGSWILLFHGTYGRMYSLFLLTSALSYMALLHALDAGGRRAWAIWALAILTTIATHPYGVLVLASQGIYVALRRRLREGALAFAAVAVLGIPFWRSDAVLAGRFDVGVGGGGSRLLAPWHVVEYLWEVAGDFSAGWWFVLAVVLALGVLGLLHLLLVRREAGLLTLAVFTVPALALMVTKLGSGASLESRHLIFVLPFFSTVVAAGIVHVERRKWRFAPAAAAVVLVCLFGSEVAWAVHRTPPLFAREPAIVDRSETAAAAWLARTWGRDEVLFAYDPVFLRAWELTRRGSQLVVPRADPTLALSTLRGAPKPLGHAVWVFDASNARNELERLWIPERLPRPHAAFEARTFGPFLVIRTRQPVRTVRRYLMLASRVMIVGKDLAIEDANVDFVTIRLALARLT
jgi:Dolichyl-phosphate-mannose-protein mannosyltransferase